MVALHQPHLLRLEKERSHCGTLGDTGEWREPGNINADPE